MLFFIAKIIKPAVFFDAVFDNKFSLCLSTVRLLTNNFSAISLFENPSQISCKTSISLTDNCSKIGFFFGFLTRLYKMSCEK